MSRQREMRRKATDPSPLAPQTTLAPAAGPSPVGATPAAGPAVAYATATSQGQELVDDRARAEQETGAREREVGHDFSRLAVTAPAGAAGGDAPDPEGEPASESGVMRVERTTSITPDVQRTLAQAAESRGEALPGDLRTRFETALSADLSGVRVHTDAAAAAAAHDVGARAYTLHEDIYFNRSQYNPATPEGQQLLAHEVAHAVQQTGAETESWERLDVTRQGDPAELEAAAAAPLMVQGEPASVREATGVARHVIARDTETADETVNVAGEMKKKTEEAEAATQKDKNYVVAGAMSTANDSKAALNLLKEIELHQPRVERGEAAFGKDSLWGGASKANVTAMGTLEQLVSENDIQDAAVSHFRQEYQKCQIDFNRLDAAFQTFNVQNDAGLDEAKTPDEMMKKINKGVMLTGYDDARMSKDIGAGGEAFALWKDARDRKNRIQELSDNLHKAQGDCITKMHGFSEIQGKMNAGVLAAKAEADPDKRAKLDAVVAENAKVKAAWSKISGALAKPAAEAAKAALPGAGTAVEKGLSAVPELIDVFYQAAIDLATLASANSKEFNQLQSVAAATHGIEKTKGELVTAVKEYEGTAKALDQERKDYLAAMEKLGAKLDSDLKTGNNAYAQIAKLTAEATTFVNQANATIEIGKTEQGQKKNVEKVRDVAINPKSGKALPWFSVRPATDLEDKAGVNQSSYGVLVRNEVTVSSMTGSNVTGTGVDQKQGGSAFGAGGANELIENQLKQLKDVRDKAQAIKERLEKKLGF